MFGDVYIEFKSADFRFLMGQTVDVISPLGFPQMVDAWARAPMLTSTTSATTRANNCFFIVASA